MENPATTPALPVPKESPLRPRRIVPERLFTNFMYLGALLGLQVGSLPFLLWYLFAFPSPSGMSTMEMLLFSTCLSILCISVPVIVWASHFPHVRAALKLSRRPRASQYLLTLLMTLCLVVLANCITYFWVIFLDNAGYVFSLSAGIPSPTNVPELIVLLLLVALIPAVIEEMLFRGVMLESYLPMGHMRAVLLTALLFALMHGSVEALPAHLLAGVALGYVVYSTDSLRTGILLHFLYNALLILQGYFSEMVWESKVFTMFLQDDWLALWPLAAGAALAMVFCFAGLRNAKTQLPALYRKKESWAVWLPMLAGLLLSIAIYAGGALEGFLPQILESLP